MNVQQLIIQSDISELTQVEKYIDQLVDQYKIDDERYGAFSLSVIEAVNNALLYGNKQDKSKRIELNTWENEGVLYVSVEDEGEGFDYEGIENPTLPENVDRIAGRGIFLMKTLSDNIIFEKNGAKVTLLYNL